MFEGIDHQAMAWIVVLVIAIMTTVDRKMERAREKLREDKRLREEQQRRALAEKFDAIKKVQETNSKEVEDVQNSLTALQMEIKRDYTPRVEFKEDLENIRRALELHREDINRTLSVQEKTLERRLCQILSEHLAQFELKLVTSYKNDNDCKKP